MPQRPPQGRRKVLGPLPPLVPATGVARGPDGTRRFEALGGYPTRTQAEAAMADALARQARGPTLDPAKLTVNQYLDHTAVSALRRAEGNSRESGPSRARDRLGASRVSAAQGLCGRDRIRTCVGNAGDFTGRATVASRIPSYPHLAPIIAGDVHKRPADSLRRPSASLPVSPQPAQLSVGRREV
jgi:hypothetical protein